MSETKDDIAAERDALREENRRLSAQLSAVGRPVGAYRPTAEFQLSEGDRQELEIYGVANIRGRMRTVDEVRAMLDPEKQGGVEIKDPPAETDRRGQVNTTEAERAGIRGFDYVYPSVAPGVIDPAVAGTPGISGPPADEVDYDPAVHGE